MLALESVEHGARQLLGFGPELQVLAPPALRDELLRQAQAVLAVNTPPTHRPRAARCGQAP
jgi:predicted DNA-binding transcriptional regulator YafY